MIDTLIRRTGRTGLRSWIHRRAARRGIPAGELERFDRFLDARLGLARIRSRDPHQRPRELFPGLATRAWHDASGFPGVAGLEEGFEAIAAEYAAVRAEAGLNPHRKSLAETGAWSTYFLHCQGHRLDAHCRRCPETTRRVDAIPLAAGAGLVYFSVLAPGTRLSAHCGPTNTRLRCHLGIVVPEGCRLRVGSETRGWREGACVVFDDSFEHEVWNDSDRERAVLIVDLWHPDLSPAERWALAELRRLSPGARRFWREIRRKSA